MNHIDHYARVARLAAIDTAERLTRAQAHDLIDDACSDLMQGEDGSHASLLELGQHWVKDVGTGAFNQALADAVSEYIEADDPEGLAAMLHGYVDGIACERADRVPRPDDITGLTAPDEQ
jgi:hypothetical protein